MPGGEEAERRKEVWLVECADLGDRRGVRLESIVVVYYVLSKDEICNAVLKDFELYGDSCSIGERPVGMDLTYRFLNTPVGELEIVSCLRGCVDVIVIASSETAERTTVEQ